MQKTKLGISVGLLGAIIYFVAAFGNNYLITIVLCGYVLLMEDNPWLKKAGVKSLLIMISCSILSMLIGLIPNAVNIVTSIISAFGSYFSISFLDGIHSALNLAITLLRMIILSLLGFKAFNQGTLKISFIDKLIDKYME